MNNVFVQYFIEGGIPHMGAITLLFAFMLFAAWKFPAWVKEIGIAALVIGIVSTLIGFYQVFGVLLRHGNDISPYVACGGFRVAMIPTIYGFIVYFISLVIRIIQKPRI